MKKKHILTVLFVFIILLTTTFVGCKRYRYYPKYEKSQVETIKIVYYEDNQIEIKKDVLDSISEEERQKIINFVYFKLNDASDDRLDGMYGCSPDRTSFVPGYAILITYKNNESEMVSATGIYNVTYQNDGNTIIEQAHACFIQAVHEVIGKLLANKIDEVN